MINYENVKNIFIKQVRDYKIKIIFMIPVFLAAIVIFVIPIFSINDVNYVKGYENLMTMYKNIYPKLTTDNIFVIILFDIKFLNYIIFITFISPLFLTSEMIVSEKENRTLENLFSLPIRDSEILVGKLAVSILMVIILIVSIYLISLITVYNYSMTFVIDHLTSLKWLSVIFIFIPSLTIFMNFISIFISSKVNKMQTAQYITTLILAPAFILYAYMNKGEKSLLIDLNNILIWTSVIIVLNIILYKVVVKLFRREKILLRF